MKEEVSKEVSKYVGKKIRYYRKKKGFTQKALGERIGVKHNTVSSYENATTEAENDVLFSIANVLEVSINDLFPAVDFTDSEESLLSEENLDPSALKEKYDFVVDGEKATDEEIKEAIRLIRYLREGKDD